MMAADRTAELGSARSPEPSKVTSLPSATGGRSGYRLATAGHDVLMSMEHPVADDRSDVAGHEQPVRWTVWRQDDNGNQFEVARKDSRVEAEELAAAMQARGHKQTYWVAKASRPSP
jgi:hypothetical protein